MAVQAFHKGIQYELEEVRSGEWRWSFTPPTGARRAGRVIGEMEWATVVVRRAIDIWHLMNRDPTPRAA
jgi:hypothetical protein